MAVVPIAFLDNDTIEIVDQENGHVSTIEIVDIKHPSRLGEEDETQLVIACPVCQATSFHPVSGGSDPDSIQRLAALHRIKVKGENITKAKQFVKDRVRKERKGDRLYIDDDRTLAQIRETRTQKIARVAVRESERDDRERPAREKAERDAKDEAERVRLQEIEDAKAATQKRIDEQAKTKTVREAFRKQELEDARIAKQEAEAVKTKLRSEKLVSRRITR